MKNIFYIVMILLVAIAGQTRAQSIGDPAPDFEVNLLEPDSATFMLSAQKGKVVFVYLFGNGCPYCIASGPQIESSIFQAFMDNPEFTAVGVDTWNSSSNKTSVAGFRDKTGITFPLAIKAGFVASDYQTTYDRLMVIDKNGTLVHKGIVVAKNDINNTVEAINQSLGITGLDLISDGPHLSVYPNPVSDVLHIAAGINISGVSLYEITGKRVIDVMFSDLSESSSIEIPLQHLEQGVYFYTIQSDGTPYTGKLLIQR